LLNCGNTPLKEVLRGQDGEEYFLCVFLGSLD
jgi:hypothetical protein